MHILVAIGATLALLPWLATPSQASERTVAHMGGLQATISQTTQWCGETVEVRVHAPEAAQLSGDTRQLQLLAGGVRQILGLECPSIQQLQLIGSVDGQTIEIWTHTADGQLIAAQMATPPASTGQSTPIGREEIAEAQQILSELGYEPGPVDGLMGANTKRAIQQFQRDQRLALDGVASPQLLEKLRSVVAARQSGPAVAESSPRPSFDCARAGTPTESAICASPELARLDRQMADAYTAARADASNPSAVVSAQRSWIARRNACAGDVTCLRISMQNRLAALEGTARLVSSSGTELADSFDISAARKEPDAVSPEGGQPDSTYVREDGIRVHSSGRMIVPWPVTNTHSPEGQQYQALIRLLRHAEVAETMREMPPSEMAPSDYPAFYADIARDYLSPSEFQPFFCTPDEMRVATDCVDFGHADHAYAAAGGRMLDRSAEHLFLWWRGETEFERRRTMNAFAESGLREQIIASAPDIPIKLLYSIDVQVQSYDFEANAFPVQVHPGIARIKPPGENGGPFDLAEFAQPVSVPPAAAEALRRSLTTRNDGRSELTLGVEMDISLQDPGNASKRQRWDAKVGSAAYFLDADAMQPLATVIEEVTGQSAEAPLPGGASLAEDTATDTILRQFDLQRQDGRIVLGFEGYGEPTPETFEAIYYLFSTAARDFVEDATEDLSRHRFAVLFSILNDDVRTRYFECLSIKDCYNRKTKSYFTGGNEFEARQSRNAFDEEIAPKLIAEAPPLPIPMRIYLGARLSEYDFDKEGFEVRIFQEARPEIDSIPPMFNFKPIFDLVPGFIPMSPDSAERLINAAEGDPVLRIDYDVLNFRLLTDHIEIVTKIRPVAVVLMTGENNDTIHFEQTYAAADQESGQGDATHAFLGPDIAEMSSPQEPTAYPVLGVAPGMTMEASVDALSQSFSEAEITVADDILRAERGYCSYDATEGEVDKNDLGAICFVARLKDQRVYRVALKQIVHPGQLRNLNDETRARFGAPDSRGEGDVPAGSMLREFFGWGEELKATRAMLGRPEIGIPALEAEVDHIYVNSDVAVFTLRADMPQASASTRAGDGELLPKEATSETSSSAPDAHGAQGYAATEEPLQLLGIRLGMSKNQTRSVLVDQFAADGIAFVESDMLAAEDGPCLYHSVADANLAKEAGSACALVRFGDDAATSVMVRNVVPGAQTEALTGLLSSRFGPTEERVEASGTVILGWGAPLSSADELDRDLSAGQTPRTLEARISEAQGVTLVTLRLDADPTPTEPQQTTPEIKF